MKWNLPSCNKPLKCRLKNINPGTYFLNFTILQYRIILKISPGTYIIPRPFWGAYFRKDLSMERNLRFKLDWASLIVGRTFTALLCLLCIWPAISKYKPPGAYIWRGDLTEGFLCYEFGGLIFGGAYTWNDLFSEFYGILQWDVQKFAGFSCTYMRCHWLHKNWQQTVATFSLNMFSV